MKCIWTSEHKHALSKGLGSTAPTRPGSPFLCGPSLLPSGHALPGARECMSPPQRGDLLVEDGRGGGKEEEEVEEEGGYRQGEGGEDGELVCW